MWGEGRPECVWKCSKFRRERGVSQTVFWSTMDAKFTGWIVTTRRHLSYTLMNARRKQKKMNEWIGLREIDKNDIGQMLFFDMRVACSKCISNEITNRDGKWDKWILKQKRGMQKKKKKKPINSLFFFISFIHSSFFSFVSVIVHPPIEKSKSGWKTYKE